MPSRAGIGAGAARRCEPRRPAGSVVHSRRRGEMTSGTLSQQVCFGRAVPRAIPACTGCLPCQCCTPCRQCGQIVERGGTRLTGDRQCPLAAVVKVDFLRHRGITTAIEIAPVEAVVAPAKALFLIEQRADMTTRLAATRTTAAGIAMRPVAAGNRDRRIGYRTRRTGQRNREHKGATVTQHHRCQAQCVGEKPAGGPPMAPETPVTEKVPGHQRRREETTHQRRYGKDNIDDERNTGQSPANCQ